MLQFVCDVVKDTGKEEYLRPFIRTGLDWNKIWCSDRPRSNVKIFRRIGVAYRQKGVVKMWEIFFRKYYRTSVTDIYLISALPSTQ